MARQFHSSLKLVDVAKKINLKKETSTNQQLKDLIKQVTKCGINPKTRS